MPRFFVEAQAIADDRIILTGENAHHLSYSLRGRVGDEVDVCDGSGALYRCTVQSMDGVSVLLSVREKTVADTEPPYEVVLCQGLPKSDKMDLIVQKATELGVSRIIIFESANCVAKLKPEQKEKKLSRWQKIAEEAAKQCGRGRIPVMDRPCTFDELLEEAEGANRFLCYEGGGLPLSKAFSALTADDPVFFMIGPEGGFTPAEAERAAASGFKPVSLGRRILRTETAPMYFLSALSYECEK